MGLAFVFAEPPAWLLRLSFGDFRLFLTFPQFCVVSAGLSSLSSLSSCRLWQVELSDCNAKKKEWKKGKRKKRKSTDQGQEIRRANSVVQTAPMGPSKTEEKQRIACQNETKIAGLAIGQTRTPVPECRPVGSTDL